MEILLHIFSSSGFNIVIKLLSIKVKISGSEIASMTGAFLRVSAAYKC